MSHTQICIHLGAVAWSPALANISFRMAALRTMIITLKDISVCNMGPCLRGGWDWEGGASGHGLGLPGASLSPGPGEGQPR